MGCARREWQERRDAFEEVRERVGGRPLFACRDERQPVKLTQADPTMDLAVGWVWIEIRGMKRGTLPPLIEILLASFEPRLLGLLVFVVRNPKRLIAPSVKLAALPFSESF